MRRQIDHDALISPADGEMMLLPDISLGAALRDLQRAIFDILFPFAHGQMKNDIHLLPHELLTALRRPIA